MKNLIGIIVGYFDSIVWRLTKVIRKMASITRHTITAKQHILYHIRTLRKFSLKFVCRTVTRSHLTKNIFIIWQVCRNLDTKICHTITKINYLVSKNNLGTLRKNKSFGWKKNTNWFFTMKYRQPGRLWTVLNHFYLSLPPGLSKKSA